MTEYTGPIQHKRATSDVWASATVPLREGEIGVDLTVKRIKVGDGSTLFPDLPWATPDNTTIAELEALAAQIGDTVSLADAQMTAVQADPESAFSIANKATLLSTVSTYIGTGTAVDTAAINALLAANPAQRKTVILRGSIGISGALVVPSRTVLDARGATLAIVAGHTGCLVRNKGAFPVVTGTGSIPAGSKTLTTALALTVGQTVTVAGADGGGTTVHTGTVTAVGSGTVTLDAAAKTTVTNAAVKVFDRDADVHIIGGVWDRASAGPGTDPGGQHIIYPRHVDGFTVDVEGEKSTGAKYACSVASATRGSISLRGLDVHSDGLHIMGPARDIDVPIIQGTTGDDAFAITAADWAAYGDSGGDVVGISLGDIQASSGAGLFKVISGSGYVADAVKLRGQIVGTAKAYCVYVGDDTAQASTTGGTYGLIDFGSLSARTEGTLVVLNAPSGEKITGKVSYKGGGVIARGIRAFAPASGLGSDAKTLKALDIELDIDTAGIVTTGGAATSINAFIKEGASFAIGTVRLTGKFIANAIGGLIVDHIAGAVGEYQPELSGTFQSTTQYGMRWSGGTIERITSLRGTIAGASNLLRRETTTTGTLILTLGAGFRAVACSRVADVRAGTTIVRLDMPLFDSLINAAFFTNGGAMTLDGRYQKVGSAALIQRSGSEAVRVLSSAIEADLAILAKNNGDAAFNTNATLSCGVGPAVSDGSNWKNLYSGATY